MASRFATGKRALSISDRSGVAFPYIEMVREWTGAWVHISEFEIKQPQLNPRPVGADPQALQQARTPRTEFYTPTILPNNPFTTTAGSTTVTVNQPNHGRSTGDAVSFTNVQGATGGVSAAIFLMETTLVYPITSTQTTLTLTGSKAFPTTQLQQPLGYIVIQPGSNSNETIQFTGNNIGTGVLSGLTRGTSAPTYDLAPLTTTASAHSAGNTVRGTHSITKVDDNSYTFILNTAASAAGTGGGFPVFAGPVNTRA